MKFILPILLLLLVPVPALAHAPIEGIGDFYNGILHPLLVPVHLICLIAVGLLAGQQSEPEHCNVTLAPRGFLFALLAGLLGAALGLGFDGELVLLPIAFAAGILTAVGRPLHPVIFTGVAAMAGLVLGLDSSPDGLAGKALFLSLLGTLLGAALGLFYIALVGSRLHKPWQQIAIRVVASWTAASAMLVFALRLFG